MGIRRSMDSSSEFLVIEGQFVGLYMGADFTAEHEWGIKKLHELFGVDGSGEGIEKVQAKRGVSEKCILSCKKKGVTYLICREPHFNDEGHPYIHEEEELKIFDDKHYKQDKPFTFAWCESSFAAATNDKTYIGYLEELKEAMLKGDLLIYLGNPEPQNPFARAGLCVVIASKTPQFIVDFFTEGQKDES